MKDESIVRENLMTVQGYSPYCGNDRCVYRNPRTKWIPLYAQFTCACGRTSNFPLDFINRYIEKWGLTTNKKQSR